MIPTTEYIRKKFDEYNTQMFGGVLRPIPVRLSRARTYIGQIRYTRRRTLFGAWRYSDFVFTISTRTDLPEREVEDTIIHEMIHYWIFSGNMRDDAPHGSLFRKKMAEINAMYNRNIAVSHKRTKEEMDNDTEKRQHLICVSRFRNGKTGVTIAAKSRLCMLWDAMPQFPDIWECRWVVSTDTFFNRFPRALTPKVYLVDNDELNRRLAGAKELVREGDCIKVGSNCYTPV